MTVLLRSDKGCIPDPGPRTVHRLRFALDLVQNSGASLGARKLLRNEYRLSGLVSRQPNWRSMPTKLDSLGLTYETDSAWSIAFGHGNTMVA
jgi:hypothetical protein